MSKYIEQVKKVMEAEARGILETSNNIEIDLLVEEILRCNGKIALTGVGKSGLIARKISATMSSLNIASYFIHPVDALHGDLGTVQSSDLIIMLSKSGESEEIVKLAPSIQARSCKIVAITSKLDSSLGRVADIVVGIPRLQEADPFSLVPSVSTTAMLALGDAIAITVMQLKKFSKEDFSLNHPAGTIGKRLNLKVVDIMKTGYDIPKVGPDSSLQDAIFEISSKGLGATLVMSKTAPLSIIGIITDGDIRRTVEKNAQVWNLTAKEIMCREPIKIEEIQLASNALELMEKWKITVLPVVDINGNVSGILHLHQLFELF
ncbi:KpsF/GutQ family sugar-phosphate isomerase [Paenibacillus oleatilyticus]|uniref:SIS domain-containing protein n=1 Tax=Paenibacillus oleatilyticus TaxID=2594886 RepID=A0ABV4V4W9_9BACL